MKNFILDIIYPPVCGICNQISKENLCNKCKQELDKYKINSIKRYNSYCDEAFFVYKYDGLVRDTILSYKFQNKAYLYKTLSKIILKNEKACAFLKKYDIIIPVPIHKNRKRQRGYNQTALIAKEIAEELKLNLENNILLKKSNIKSQSELNKKERKLNIKDAFSIQKSEILNNKKVLLLDDIYTTGSTVIECARVLKQSNCTTVGVLTIAKD